MKLYDSRLAPNPRRVRIFMAEKGMTCDTEQLDIVKGENLTDDFLNINPRGILPTLVRQHFRDLAVLNGLRPSAEASRISQKSTMQNLERTGDAAGTLAIRPKVEGRILCLNPTVAAAPPL